MARKIKKRDGRLVNYNRIKIYDAILAASKDALSDKSEEELSELADKYSKQVQSILYKEIREGQENPTVDHIQDTVENVLIKNKENEIAKAYIIYRNNRDNIRDMGNKLFSTIREITSKDKEDMDLKRENANIDSDTSMGGMLKIGSETSKKFTKMYYLRPEVTDAHENGDIHIHDLDFYPFTCTCCQIDISKLFDKGFSTGHGYIRQPSNIISASALACIIMQSNQNEMHGGQSIPALDYYLAPYVAKSYIKNIIKVLDICDDISNDKKEIIENRLNKLYDENNTLLGIDDKVKEVLEDVL